MNVQYTRLDLRSNFVSFVEPLSLELSVNQKKRGLVLASSLRSSAITDLSFLDISRRHLHTRLERAREARSIAFSQKSLGGTMAHPYATATDSARLAASFFVASLLLFPSPHPSELSRDRLTQVRHTLLCFAFLSSSLLS